MHDNVRFHQVQQRHRSFSVKPLNPYADQYKLPSPPIFELEARVPLGSRYGVAGSQLFKNRGRVCTRQPLCSPTGRVFASTLISISESLAPNLRSNAHLPSQSKAWRTQTPVEQPLKNEDAVNCDPLSIALGLERLPMEIVAVSRVISPGIIRV